MRIISIDFHLLDLGLTRPYRLPYKTVDRAESAIAIITLENGIRGIGTASPCRHLTGENAADTLQVLEQWDQDMLINRDIRGVHDCLDQIHRSLTGHPGAEAALDIAVHDAFTQFLEVPLVQYLGQRIPFLPTSITIGMKSTAESLEEAREYTGRGFRYLKIHLGNPIAEEVERLAAIREAVGKHVRIRVDMNEAYHSRDLLLFYDMTSELNLEMIEQPFPISETDMLKELPLNVRKLIVADECLLGAKDAFQLASYPESCGIFNVKLMKCGGIRPALFICGIAGMTDTDMMWGCNTESMISIAAALHTAMACRKTRYLDLDGSLNLSHDIAEGAFVLKNGLLSVTGRPGIGWRKLLV